MKWPHRAEAAGIKHEQDTRDCLYITYVQECQTSELHFNGLGHIFHILTAVKERSNAERSAEH